MTVREFQKCVEYNIVHGLRHAVLGLGAPGVGKSQCIRQLGEKYGYKVIDLRLAQMSEVEIAGLIYPNEDRTKTVWLTPDILPDEARDGEKTILLLDEITSCSRRVQVAAYQLILDRRIGRYRLPEGTFVIALGNREDDDGVFIQMAGPLADRFEIHFIEPDFSEWLEDFAVPRGVHQLVRDFLSVMPSALNSARHEEELVFPTPRSWERVSDILNCSDNIWDATVRHKIVGNVGEDAGKKFIAYCMQQAKPPSPMEFVQEELTPPADPDRLSVLISGMLQLTDGIREFPQADLLPRKERDLLEDVIRAMFRLPKAEYTMVGLKGLLEQNRPVVKEVFCALEDRRIAEFIQSNRYALGFEDPASPGMLRGDTKEKWLKAFREEESHDK